MIKRLLFGGFAVLLIAVGGASVLAQFNTDGTLKLTTSPLPVGLTASPGQTVKTDLKIRNGSDKKEHLKVGLMKFSAYGDEGKPKLEERGENDKYFDWVSFSQMDFYVASNEWHTIVMTVNVPADAGLGYYYAVTFSRANQPEEAKSGQTALRGGTAILVLLDVASSKAHRELKFIDIKSDKKVYEFLPARINIKLRNTGNVHLMPTGMVSIKRGDSKIAEIPFNTSKGSILPDSNRNYSIDWNEGFPYYRVKETAQGVVLKDGQPEHELVWDSSKLNKLRFGKYTAQVFAVYDNGKSDIPLEATVSFWVIPWRLIGLVITVLVVPSGGFYLLARWRYGKRLHEKEPNEKKTK